MRVTSLHTYPVKGCHRVDADSAYVQPWGLVGDRRWLIVDERDGRAVTQRETVALTHLFPRVVPGGLVLAAPGHEDLTVAEPVVGPLTQVSVFSFTGVATGGGPAADAWLTAVLGRPVRLVWQDDPSRRPVDDAQARPEDRVVFQDDFPVTVGSLASLRALNDHILDSGSDEGPLPMTRFRPNVVVDGGAAWAEDGWTGRSVTIGEVRFRVVKPCSRCVVTTTDQETGERGHEPLRALGRYRNVNQKLLFCTNLVPQTLGTVRVGDAVSLVDE